ncbi:hypothetical protein DFH29DRAFT_1018103 [Suillus ampliporus]|nr:hypothetical protein DFH29DRAFT_1018103 [Suillus ampliporus]
MNGSASIRILALQTKSHQIVQPEKSKLVVTVQKVKTGHMIKNINITNLTNLLQLFCTSQTGPSYPKPFPHAPLENHIREWRWSTWGSRLEMLYMAKSVGGGVSGEVDHRRRWMVAWRCGIGVGVGDGIEYERSSCSMPGWMSSVIDDWGGESSGKVFELPVSIWSVLKKLLEHEQLTACWGTAHGNPNGVHHQTCGNAIFPSELILAASLRVAVLDAVRGRGAALADNERKASAGKVRRNESDLERTIFLTTNLNPVGHLNGRTIAEANNILKQSDSNSLTWNARRPTTIRIHSHYTSYYVVSLSSFVYAEILEFEFAGGLETSDKLSCTFRHPAKVYYFETLHIESLFKVIQRAFQFQLIRVQQVPHRSATLIMESGRAQLACSASTAHARSNSNRTDPAPHAYSKIRRTYNICSPSSSTKTTEVESYVLPSTLPSWTTIDPFDQQDPDAWWKPWEFVRSFFESKGYYLFQHGGPRGDLSVPRAHKPRGSASPAQDSFGLYGNREGYESMFSRTQVAV